MYLKDQNVKRDPFWSQFFLVMDMRHGHADGKQRYQTQGEKHGTDDIFCRWPTSPHMFCPTALGCSAYIICSTGVDLGVKSIGFKSESGSSYSCDLRNEKYLLEHQHIHLLKMGLMVYSQILWQEGNERMYKRLEQHWMKINTGCLL